MDANIYNSVKSVFDQQGVPEYVWFPIMQFESGGNPNAVGDSGVSIGLFQLNTAGGQGTGYDKQYLK
ncbi:MAG TPA: transglycosylase SLT domain-containing protein, partial [Candidatus Paceibacterota bacterium]